MMEYLDEAMGRCRSRHLREVDPAGFARSGSGRPLVSLLPLISQPCKIFRELIRAVGSSVLFTKRPPGAVQLNATKYWPAAIDPLASTQFPAKTVSVMSFEE